jgi:hypothetical protein
VIYVRKYWLDAIAVIGAVLGSLMVAANAGVALLGYLLFLASSTASVVLMRRSNVSRSLVALNVYFMFVNVVGIIRHWS